MRPILDDPFFEKHFQTWLIDHRHIDIDKIEVGIRNYVEKHPETITEMGWSWPEIESVATREGYIS